MPDSNVSGEPKRYLVYRGEEKILEITDQSGPLISKSAPPPLPGAAPVSHPFLSATTYVREQEEVLREALNRSTSLTEYLMSLRSMGFKVEESSD